MCVLVVAVLALAACAASGDGEVVSWSDVQPSWSPDGERLVFVRFEHRYGSNGPRGGIFTMRPDGSDARQLTHVTHDSDLHTLNPVWSLDGTRIAFDAKRADNVGASNVYVMNADGSDIRQLTVYGAGPPAVHAASVGGLASGTDRADSAGGELYASTPVVYGYYSPTWSPDGTRVAFSSLGEPGTRNPSDIFSINPDGSDLRRLTRNLDARDPAWSPDGARIAFRRYRGNIFVVAADGGDVRQLTGDDDLTDAGDFFDWAPAWSPDGARIAFERSVGTSSTIIVTCADGTGLRQLPNTGFNRDPAWSPDGTRIAFGHSADEIGPYKIRIVDVVDLTESQACLP